MFWTYVLRLINQESGLPFPFDTCKHWIILSTFSYFFAVQCEPTNLQIKAYKVKDDVEVSRKCLVRAFRHLNGSKTWEVGHVRRHILLHNYQGA